MKKKGNRGRCMKPIKKDIQVWVKALRSGKYKQTKGTLQNNQGYCCLGVACDLFIENKETNNGFLIGGLPLFQSHCPYWLQGICSDFQIKAGHHLSALNDIQNFSFDEIADILEAVYILEVLK